MKTEEELFSWCCEFIDDGYGLPFKNWNLARQMEWVSNAFSEYQSSGFVQFRHKYIIVGKNENIFK